MGKRDYEWYNAVFALQYLIDKCDRKAPEQKIYTLKSFKDGISLIANKHNNWATKNRSVIIEALTSKGIESKPQTNQQERYKKRLQGLSKNIGLLLEKHEGKYNKSNLGIAIRKNAERKRQGKKDEPDGMVTIKIHNSDLVKMQIIINKIQGIENKERPANEIVSEFVGLFGREG